MSVNILDRPSSHFWHWKLTLRVGYIHLFLHYTCEVSDSGWTLHERGGIYPTQISESPHYLPSATSMKHPPKPGSSWTFEGPTDLGWDVEPLAELLRARSEWRKLLPLPFGLWIWADLSFHYIPQVSEMVILGIEWSNAGLIWMNSPKRAEVSMASSNKTQNVTYIRDIRLERWWDL